MTGLLVALAGCDEQTPVVVTASPSRSTAPASPQPTVARNLKPMLHGLIDRDGPPAQALRKVVTNFVVPVNWSDLQPTPGDIVANNAIDQAISAAQRMNAVAGQPPVAIKVRLYAGVYAPAWAKQLGGAPVAVSAGALTGTVGRFWTDAFGAAYADLWQRLAARYDAVPEIREVTVSRCMTFYAETMIRDVEDPSTVQNLLSAGFTINADKSCISQEIQLGTAWHSTRIGVAFNPYQLVVGAGVHASDEDFTEQMMHVCRTTLGSQCVLENNSIRFPLQPGLYQQMYEAMILLGSPISFQTAALARIGDLTTTLHWAASVGANAVELPKGYSEVPAATLASIVAALPVSKA
ncbi:MAG: hypothetical protein M3019_12475 [Candidatus Dormibacteraeota bacterium]|nr:hypothetical protein [Candidatus Dormibacteraeota bacterium]